MSNLHKILVIEDEQNICNFLRTVLEIHDYQVILANSGSNGKTMFLSYNPDLVILDFGLPDMDGTEELLSIHAGRVLTYAEIVKKVWGYSDSGSIKKLQVNMANIRKKFGERPGEYKYILNELGVGYRMNADTE